MRLFTLWSIGVAALSIGQSRTEVAGAGLLELPSPDAFVCHEEVIDKDQGDARVAHRLTFEIGEGPFEDTRTIDVSYAADGAPVSLIDNILRPRAEHGATLDAAMVRLDASPPRGIVSHMDQRVLDSTAVEPGARTMRGATAAELEQARRLAAWLWEKRCLGRRS